MVVSRCKRSRDHFELKFCAILFPLTCHVPYLSLISLSILSGTGQNVTKLYVVPGNDALFFPTKADARLERIPIKLDIKRNVQKDIANLAIIAKDRDVLAFVGPEQPLSAGIVDVFENMGVPVVGPSKQAARLEASKAAAKEIMEALGIPIPQYANFSNPKEANEYINSCHYQIVVKADGLAAGKASIVTSTPEGAHNAVKRIMVEKEFGDAGDRVVIEKRLYGEEFSFFLITDGKSILPLGWGRDYKQINDNNKGPNTGGMGAYSPYGSNEAELTQLVMKRIAEPLIYGCRDGVTVANGSNYKFTYKGIMYIGGTFVRENETLNPYVFEINVRMGDPEAQVIYPRLNTDLVDISRAIVEDRLSEISTLTWDQQYHLCVCLTSGAMTDENGRHYKGYPNSYKSGREIYGLENLLSNTLVFHNGTKWDKERKLFLTTGGRVLTIGCSGATLQEAKTKTYEEVKKVTFDGCHYRNDIGHNG